MWFSSAGDNLLTELSSVEETTSKVLKKMVSPGMGVSRRDLKEDVVEEQGKS